MTDHSLDDWLLDPSLAPSAENDPLVPLYEASSRNELALPFCSACAQPLEFDQEVCDRCSGSERDWRTVDLEGVVHAATLMHRREPGLVHAQSPYPIVDVELTSGHRMIMTTVRPADAPPAMGAHVLIGFRSLGGVRIPAIEPSEDE